MKDQIFKIATFNDLGNSNREDVNGLISSLVRLGYGVYMNNEYICFKVGYDDIVEDAPEEIV